MGLGVLADAIKCEVLEERNGRFELEMTYAKEGILFKEIKNDRIIKVDVGHELKAQRFSIEKITKNFDGTLQIFAVHCSYLSERLGLKPEVIINGSANTAINQWNNNLIGQSPFIVDSDIQTTGKTIWNIKEVDNPRIALGGVKGSLLDVYGGEFRFDNYHISLMKSRGNKTGYRISYGRNLTNIEQEDYISSTYTSVYPFAVQREDKQNNQEEKVITTNGYIVHSEHVDKYSHPRIIPIDFTSEFEEDEKITSDKLKSLATKYIKNNSIGIPKVSLEVEFVDLEQTLDHQDEVFDEKINLCDEVLISFEEMGIDITDKVTSIIWDVLSDRYLKLNVGDAPRTLGSKLKDLDGKVQEAEKNSNNALTSANGKNTNFYGPDEPIANKVGDTWFKDIGNGEYEIYQWNGTIWELVSFDYSVIEKELEQHKEDIKNALDNSEQAIKEADFVGGKLEDVENTLGVQNSKIDEIDKQSISNGKWIEENETSIKETIAQTDENGKKLIQIEKNTEGLSSTVIDLQKDFENLELPARNLVRDSLVEKCSTSYLFQTFETVEAWSKEDEYQFLLKGNLPDGKEPRIYGEDVSGIYLTKLSKISDGLYGFKGKINDVKSLKNILKVYLYPDDKIECCVDWIAVYKNDDTLKWYPALEDNSKTLAKHWTAIEQNAQKIKETIGKTDEQGTKLTQIEKEAGRINESLVEIENQKIGGRNYFINSEKLDSGNVIGYQGSVVNVYPNQKVDEWGTDKAFNIQCWDGSSEIKAMIHSRSSYMSDGTSYSPSIFVKNNGQANVRISCNIGAELIIKGGETKRLEFNVKNSTKNGIMQFLVKPTATSANITVWHPQFEKGDKHQDWRPAWEDGDIKITNVEKNVNGIQQTVQNKADKSEVTQLANLFDVRVTGLEDDIDENYAALNILKDNINLKVNAKDIISQINLSPETILIQSKKIMLDGQVNINDAFIKKITINTAYINHLKTVNFDAAQVTSGYINSNRIQAKSITTDKLAANAIQVGFNAIGNAIKISPNELSFYSGSTLAGEINSKGVSFYSGTRAIGHIGVNSKAGNSSVKGLVMDLDYTGDFVSWGFSESASASTYTGMLSLDPKGKFTGEKGVHIPGLLHLNQIRPAGKPYQNLEFTSVVIGSTKYPALMAATSKNGIAFGSQYLYIINNGNSYNFNDISKLISKLSGLGKVAIPTGFDGQGNVQGWYDMYL